MVKNVVDNSCSSHGGGTNINSWRKINTNTIKIKDVNKKHTYIYVYVYVCLNVTIVKVECYNVSVSRVGDYRSRK